MNVMKNVDVNNPNAVTAFSDQEEVGTPPATPPIGGWPTVMPPRLSESQLEFLCRVGDDIENSKSVIVAELTRLAAMPRLNGHQLAFLAHYIQLGRGEQGEIWEAARLAARAELARMAAAVNLQLPKNSPHQAGA